MIITSLLDTDLYKFSTMQCVLHGFPGAQAEYRFKCRTQGVNLQPYIDEIRQEIHDLCQLRFSTEELEYLSTLRHLKSDFIDFLGLFQLQEKYIQIEPGQSPGEISISAKGPLLHIILFEIYILAIVNEVYFRNTYPDLDWSEGRRRLQEKIALVNEKAAKLPRFKIAEYGTRRRFSKAWLDEVTRTLKDEMGTYLAGTSNAYMAWKHKLVPLGTMGHEFFQACQALGPRLRDSQVFALENWAKEYRGDLGIALSDVYGIEAFLRDFDLYFCKLFDGVRHDSGDPIEWGERVLQHYERMRVDPSTKTLVFSDGLTFAKALEIAEHFKNRCKMSFGVGTHLSNDMGVPALQIVMKMVRCNGQPVAKISDDPGKTMCDDPAYMDYLRHVFNMPAQPK